MLLETEMYKLTPEVVRAILESKVLADETIKKSVSKLAKKIWEQIKIDFGIVFSKYTENVYEKYHKIKTILYKTEPKYIYNFFECPYLRKGHGELLSAENIEDLMKISHFLLIQGSGGIGKSTLMKHFLIDTMSKNLLIPIFIELKTLNSIKGNYDINNFVFEKLSDLGSTISKEYMEYALKSGCFLFLLDGYDEIATEKRVEFYEKFDSFCDRYSKNYFIISSRPYSDFIDFQRFTILTLQEFNKSQSISLIKKLDFDEDIKERFIVALDEKLYYTHISFASNPLLLTIMLLTFENYAEIPKKLHLFYEQAFETLYYKHDATKAGFRREMRCGLTYDLFKSIFSIFCFSTYYQNKFEFSQDELKSALLLAGKNIPNFCVDDYIFYLVNSICVLYIDGFDYKFTHRSFQENFTAMFLRDLSDDRMKTVGIKLVKKDMHRSIHDNVFSMLYDISESRVEKNLLLPILNEIESDCVNDKYSFYLNQLDPIFSFHIMDNKLEIMWVVRKRGNQNLADFVSDFARYYVPKENKKVTDSLYTIEDLLFEQLNPIIEEKLKMDENINVFDFDIRLQDYLNNEKIIMLFRKSWIGKHIETLSQLGDMLRKRQEKSEFDLNELLQEEVYV